MLRSVLVLSLLGGTAYAQTTQVPSSGGFDAHSPYTPIGDGDLMDPLSMWRAEAQERNSGGIMALFEYATAPVVLYRTTWDGNTTREPLLDQLVGVNIGGQYNPHERVGIALGMPLWFTSQAVGEAQGAGLGDLELSIPIGLILADEDKPFSAGLSIIPFGKAPTGTQAKNLGSGSFTGGGHLVTTLRGGRVSSSLSVGAEYAPEAFVANLDWGSTLRYGATFGVKMTEGFAMHLEGNGRYVLTGGSATNTRLPIEVLLSARGATKSGVRFQGGVGAAVTEGTTASVFRAFAGVGYAFGKGKKRTLEIVQEEPAAPAPPPAPVDSDNDGVVDNVDQCIGEVEDGLGELPTDGCPQPVQVASATNEVLPPPPVKIDLPVIRFAFDSASLGRRATAELDKLASQLQEAPQLARVIIEGHTDAIGSDDYNVALSQRRASAVLRYLTKQGVPSNLLQIEARGEAKPIETNGSAEGRAANRRVRFRLEEKE